MPYVYVIEHKYVGANQDSEQFVDADRIEISKKPATTNSSYVERIKGWCGTTNDWAIYAHGEYETTELARKAIADKFGSVRDVDANGDEFLSSDENVIEVFKLGKFEPLSRQATSDWAFEGIEEDITIDTTDSEIDKLVGIYESNANSEGYTLDSDLEDFMKAHRAALVEED